MRLEQLEELMVLQGQLDDAVLANLDLPENTDLRAKRAIAMVCEFCEGGDDSLEERADFLHFILSYALDAGLSAQDLLSFWPDHGNVVLTSAEARAFTMQVLASLLNLHEGEWKFWKKRHRYPSIDLVKDICSKLLYGCFASHWSLALTTDSLIEAYKVKNAENHRRQQEGY